MNRRYLLIGLAVAAVALGGGTLAIARTLTDSTSALPVYRGSTPPSGIRLPAFRLRDPHGRIVQSDRLRGRVVVVTFLESKCKTACPFIAGTIGTAFRRMSQGQRQGVTAIALSVNPNDDTPSSVRAFLRREQAARFVQYLVGSEPKLRPVWNAFHVLPAIDTGDADTHSASVRIFDRGGEWVSNLHVGVDLTSANLIHDIASAKGS
jgi:protein SCO1/2